MILFEILLIVLGAISTAFGYLIYFKEKYHLINGFETDYKAGRKSESYAKKVGLTELLIGIIAVLIGAVIMMFR